MQLLQQSPAANGHMIVDLPVGQWGALMVVFHLTAGAGVTLTRADLGNVKLSWNGSDIVNVDCEIINLLNNIYGGTSLFASAVGAACDMALIIPTGMWWDSKNIYNVGFKDRVSIQLDFPLLSVLATCAAGTVSVYGKEKVGVHQYFHHIEARQEVAGGAGQINRQIPVNNISQFYLKGAATLLTDLQLTKNNKVYADGVIADLITYSDYIHVLEATNTCLAVELGESKDLREFAGGQVSYKMIFSGAGTQQIYISYIEYDGALAIASAKVAQNELIQRINAT